MAMVLHYGVANIVNAALNLLQVGNKLWVDFKVLFKDEEEEVRESAARFASGLPRVDSKVQKPKSIFCINCFFQLCPT